MTPAVYFDGALAAFARAAARGSTEENLRIAGSPVRLSFAGDALVPLTMPALAHRRYATPAEPALRICLWDGASTASPPPRPFWSPDRYRRYGIIDPLNDTRYAAAFLHDAGGLQLLDRQTGTGVFWVKDPAGLPNWERAAPLRNLWHWWFGGRGIHLVHAGAVGDGRGAVLLAGPGGSGKSSTALQCLQSPLKYLADDYCLLSTDAGGEFRVHSLFSTGKLDSGGVSRLRWLNDAVINPQRVPEEKALLFLHVAAPGSLGDDLPVRALVIPRVAGVVNPRLEPARGGEALLALAPSSLFQLPGGGYAAAFAALAHLVRQVPCYRLLLGGGGETVPSLLAGLLEDAPSVRAPAR